MAVATLLQKDFWDCGTKVQTSKIFLVLLNCMLVAGDRPRLAFSQAYGVGAAVLIACRLLSFQFL